MKNRIFGKGLAYGIIVLFLGTSIVPLAGSISTEKEQSVISKSYLEDIVISGTMGENGWYVSDVTVTAVGGNFVYYRFDEGAWIVYTAPFSIGEGIHLLEWTPDMEHFFCKLFKIDTTSPQIILIKETIGINEVNFIANVYDATSGVWRVEFYLDDELVYTDNDFPFEWTWEGSGNHMVTATVFDFAGNSASSSMSTPYVQSQNILGVQQINQLIHNLILRHQTTR